jgi:hypothetical protein
MMHPGNFEFHLVATERMAFDRALEILFLEERKVRLWTVTDDQWLELHFYGNAGPKLFPLPYEMTVEGAKEFAWGWLVSQEKPHTRYIDHDGSTNADAFEVTNGQWGCLCRIRKEWALYYK